MTMTVGSAVATYSFPNPAVISDPIFLHIEPVTMSVARMTTKCRERYKTALTKELLDISEDINYQICTKSLCLNISGTPGGGAIIGESFSSTLQMYVAINTKALKDAVKLDYDKATVTYRFSAFLKTFNYA